MQNRTTYPRLEVDKLYPYLNEIERQYPKTSVRLVLVKPAFDINGDD